MVTTKAATRYAKALLELAIENNQVDSVLDDMNYLLKISNENRDFDMLLKSPIVNSSKKIQIFQEIFGRFQKVSLMFVELITNKGRENLLPQIANSFRDQVNQYNKIIPLTITSAVPLSGETKEKILSKLKEKVSGSFNVIEKVDPSLIGGFIVRMDDKQINASVANQLENLKQRLTR